MGHVVRYKERVREFCRRQAEAGIREIVLVGESDLEFLLEWCAEKEGMRFRTVEEDEISGSSPTVLWVISERAGAQEAKRVQSNPDRVVRLADLIAPPVGDVISDGSVRGDVQVEE